MKKCAEIFGQRLWAYSNSSKYVGGPKRNRKRSLMGGSVVVHASAARCLLRGPE